MKKKIVSIIFTLMIEALFLSSFVYGKSFDKKGIYRVSNPITNASVICKGDGTVIMKTMNGGNEFIDVLDDEKTNMPALIYKRIEGETIVNKKYFKENGELDYEYNYPSYRMELYDIDGKYIGYNMENISYISNVIGDKVLYYKDVEGMANKHAFLYDIKTKKEEKAKYPCVEVIKDKKIIVMSYYPYTEDGKRETLICDYDFNEIKKIDNYNFNYDMYVKDKTYIKVSTAKKEDGENKMYYNILDKSYGFIFDEDLDTDIYANDDGIGEVNSDKRIVQYDFINDKLIKDEKKEVDNRKINLEKEIKDGELIGITDGYYKKNENGKTLIYDNDLNLTMTLNKKYNYMVNYKYGEDIVYIGDNGYYDEKKEMWVEENDVYDKNGKLIFEKCSMPDVTQEEGLIYIDGRFYDFEFNIVKDMGDNKRNDRFDWHKVGEKTFFANRYTKDYMLNEKYNVYDGKLNLLYEDVEDSDFYSLKNSYSIVKDGKTTVYDINGQIKKKFDEPITLSRYNDEKYMICFNKNTKRYSIMDENFNILLSNYKMLTDLQDDYCTFVNGFKYGLVDYEGKILLSFSIFDTMKDDAIVGDGFSREYEYVE